ncbi:hypothetical protein ABT223_45925 [Streptomyces sviceus]
MAGRSALTVPGDELGRRKGASILDVVPAENLVPDGQVAAKPYKRLRQALNRSSKVAIAKW